MPKWLKIILKLIKHECDKHCKCTACPLWEEGDGCIITTPPCFWPEDED